MLARGDPLGEVLVSIEEGPPVEATVVERGGLLDCAVENVLETDMSVVDELVT